MYSTSSSGNGHAKKTKHLTLTFQKIRLLKLHDRLCHLNYFIILVDKKI